MPERACNNLAMRDTQSLEPKPPLSRRGLALLLSVPALCGTVVGCFTAFSRPMGGYWDDALALAHNGRIPQDFTPAGYPELVALGIRLLPAHPQAGAIAIQVLLHVAIAVNPVPVSAGVECSATPGIAVGAAIATSSRVAAFGKQNLGRGLFHGTASSIAALHGDTQPQRAIHRAVA